MERKDLVLVTGGTGFLGGHCIVGLLRRGYQVRTTVRDLIRASELRATIASAVGEAANLDIVEADLGSDRGWREAVSGSRYVLHAASPFPAAQPRNADELIAPARDGTLRILRACLDAKAERVVLTSSSAAMSYPDGGTPDPVTEQYWTNPDHSSATPYVKSKVLAERAAWDFVGSNQCKSLLTVVAPSAILGPVLNKDFSYSVQVVSRLLSGSAPVIPRLGFPFVDVRDVAELHLQAMTSEVAAGERYLGSGEFHWLEDVASILRRSLGSAAKHVPRRRAPDFVVRLIAMVDPGLRAVAHELGRKRIVSSEKAENTFAWSPRSFEETVLDCANSLIRVGAVLPSGSTTMEVVVNKAGMFLIGLAAAASAAAAFAQSTAGSGESPSPVAR
jgi:dihydroflavonol-4-reductase